MSGATGVLAGAAIAGLGVSAVGISQQNKANNAANATNQEAIAKADQSAWNSYLMGRGIYGGNAAPGVIPTNAQAVNSKLPLWANVTRTPAGGGTARWVKKGTIPTPATSTLATTMPGQQTQPATTTGAYFGGGGAYGPSTPYSGYNLGQFSNTAEARGDTTIPQPFGQPTY